MKLLDDSRRCASFRANAKQVFRVRPLRLRSGTGRRKTGGCRRSVMKSPRFLRTLALTSVVEQRRRCQSTLVEPAIMLRGVGRIYPSGSERVTAIHGVDLVIYPHEAVAITGPSGSGKTTLLNLVAGLDRPTSGEISVLGHFLNSLSEGELTAFRAKSIGLVFQDPHLLAGLSALENVAVARLPLGKRSQLLTAATH